DAYIAAEVKCIPASIVCMSYYCLFMVTSSLPITESYSCIIVSSM
ncbi:hypothetical protein X975_13374, partial [Stegodyphus mimosarum]